jgi:hypothetical protein
MCNRGTALPRIKRRYNKHSTIRPSWLFRIQFLCNYSRRITIGNETAIGSHWTFDQTPATDGQTGKLTKYSSKRPRPQRHSPRNIGLMSQQEIPPVAKYCPTAISRKTIGIPAVTRQRKYGMKKAPEIQFKFSLSPVSQRTANVSLPAHCRFFT